MKRLLAAMLKSWQIPNMPQTVQMLAEDERSGSFVESREAMMGREGRYTVLGEVIMVPKVEE